MDIILSNELMSAIHKVGELIKCDARYSNMVKISEEYNADREINKLLGEYAELQQNVTKEFDKPDFSDDRIKELQVRMDEIYSEISNNPSYIQFREASDEYNEFTQAVYNELEYAVTGKKPVSCTHDCSTCHGCD